MRRKITSTNLKALLNSIAVQDTQTSQDLTPDEELFKYLGIMPADATEDELALFRDLKPVISALAIIGGFAVTLFLQWLKDVDRICLKLWTDSQIQALLDELKALMRLFNESEAGGVESTGDAIFAVLGALADIASGKPNAQVLLLKAMDDVLEKIKDLMNTLSDGKCAKDWGELFYNLVKQGIKLPDWFTDDYFEKVVNGNYKSSDIIGAALIKAGHQQLAATWASEVYLRQFNVETTVLTENTGIDWGSVGIATAVAAGVIVGGVVIVYSGGWGAGIVVGALSGLLGGASTALADTPPEQIKQEVSSLIDLYKDLANQL